MNKKINKVFRFLLCISFAVFVALYLSQTTGYTEYQNRKQVTLTNNQIKKFEQDVAEGKQIDIKHYLKINNHDYQNNLSRFGLKVSKLTGKTVKTAVDKTFKFLSKLSE